MNQTNGGLRTQLYFAGKPPNSKDSGFQLNY